MTYASGVELLAHRGLVDAVPENSLAAIEKAWAAGAHGVEIDVRVSDDDVVYLFHDDVVDGLSVGRATFDEIQARAGLDDAPRLAEVFALGEFEGDYLLDIKEVDVARILVLLKAVEATGFPLEKLVFQNERVENLSVIKRRFTGARTCLLDELKRRPPFFLRPSANRLLGTAEEHNVDALSIKGRRFLDHAFIDTLKSTGMHVYVWTINDPERAVYYRDIGVDSIITDRIDALQRAMEP